MRVHGPQHRESVERVQSVKDVKGMGSVQSVQSIERVPSAHSAQSAQPGASVSSLSLLGSMHRSVSASSVRAGDPAASAGASASASVFLRSLLAPNPYPNANPDTNTNTNADDGADATDVNTDSGGELTDSGDAVTRAPSNNPNALAISNYPRMLDQSADSQRLELFGCKTMPYSNSGSGGSPGPYPYRLLVAEETDQVACRNNFKVYLDRTYPDPAADVSRIRPSELRQYIFCSMFRAMNAKKYSRNEKFRPIPNSDYIILTRILYINHPHSRLAINLCLPNFLLPVICEVWAFVQHWMDETERILARTVPEYKRSPAKPRAKAKSDYVHSPCAASFAQVYSADVDRIVSILSNYLLPCFKAAYEVPRLFLFPHDDLRFVNSWFRGCFKWIQLKDGPKSGLLQAALATVLVNYRNIMNQGAGEETARIIVLSGNLPVANKLVFLIAGLLNKRVRQSLKMIDVPRVQSAQPITMDQKSSRQQRPQSIESSPCSVHSFSSVSSNSSTSSRYNHTRNGWEIPQRMSVASSASVAMSPSGTTATSGDVIQASSFRSGESSMRYLSSSLSSQQNSYGSWFNSRPSITRMLSRSPSVSGGVSGGGVGSVNANKTASALFRTPSSLSLQQSSLRQSSSVTSSNFFPDPPALNDYEESAWFGTPESMGSVDMYRAATSRTLTPQMTNGTATATSASPSDNANFYGDGVTAFVSPLKDIYIQRDCQRVDESAMLDRAFEIICEPEVSMDQTSKSLRNCRITLSHSPSNTAPVAEIDMKIPAEVRDTLKFNELLPRYTSYLPHLNRFFQIQANPYSSEAEAHILSTMRKNLHLEPNVSLVKTLVVSLQTRDIYEMMVKQHSADDKDSQRMRKIFNNGKVQLRSSSSSRKLTDCVAFINRSFDRVREIYRLIDMHEAEGHAPDGEYDVEILHTFDSIVRYMEDL